MSSTTTVSKRSLRRKDILDMDNKKKILSTFPERFNKNDFPEHDKEMKWWFVIDRNHNDHTQPVYLLSVHIDEPNIVYEFYISKFWFYDDYTKTYDYSYDLEIVCDENGVSESVIFKDMFKNRYKFDNKLSERISLDL